MFLKELMKFSKENWWIYVMLAITLFIVFQTGKGDIIEIILMFIANFLANMFVMVSMGNYAKSNNKIGSWYHILATVVFTFIGIYGYIDQGVGQYLVFQLSFILAMTKAAVYYNFGKNLSLINEYSLLGTNLILFAMFYKYFSPDSASIFQAIGFMCITTGLVSIHDNFRYSGNFVGTLFLLLGSFMLVFNSYYTGKVDGIALGFSLLTMTTFIYYLKLFPSYLTKMRDKKKNV